MKRLAVSLGCLLLLVFGSSLCAGTEFEQGNRAYENGKYIEARELYAAAISKGEATANLYYNLGNTDAQIGAPGLAMLDYERALALDPSHHDARANLKFLRDQSVAKLPARTWRDYVFGVVSLRGWVIIASVSGWTLIFILLIPVILGRRRTAAGVFALVLALCASIYASVGVWFAIKDLNAALIIAKQVEARRAPADRAELADILPVGSRVRWLHERSGWIECEMPDGSRAWVPAGTVERIRLANT